jgi:hypothetical protein
MTMDRHTESVVRSIRERRAISPADRKALTDALENHMAAVHENQQCADVITSILALDYAGMIGKQEIRV